MYWTGSEWGPLVTFCHDSNESQGSVTEERLGKKVVMNFCKYNISEKGTNKGTHNSYLSLSSDQLLPHTFHTSCTGIA
jgi:hypothetical protein